MNNNMQHRYAVLEDSSSTVVKTIALHIGQVTSTGCGPNGGTERT